MDRSALQGCHMVYFQTKNQNLGNFWRVVQWKMLVYFMDVWSILQPFGILYGLLVYFLVIWYIFPSFGMLYQEKSGNPGALEARSTHLPLPSRRLELCVLCYVELFPIWIYLHTYVHYSQAPNLHVYVCTTYVPSKSICNVKAFQYRNLYFVSLTKARRFNL
jgi:hypothetical protein